jgi:hypothetical protein
MNDSDQRNTAYAHNTRAQSPSSRRMTNDARWHPKVRELFARDYAFLGHGYESGVLFRGLSRGVAATLEAGRWLFNDDASHVAALERELGVFLFSHEISDALGVARLWESPSDAGVIVFPAGEFAQRWRHGAAAMIGFAEPGFVFKYPFFVDPLPVAATSLLLLPANATHVGDGANVLRVPSSIAGDRAATEDWALRALQDRCLTPALPVSTDDYPR